MPRPTYFQFLALPKARCVREPRGKNGLEGFARAFHYPIQLVEGKQPYYRIWLNPQDCTAFQVCSPRVFGRYFATEKTP